ncbi:MAG: acyl-CoA thioesterase [Acidimicrobiales bacterium]
MGDLAEDTCVELTGEGTYRATLSPDWEIWGPMGGYVAACALRAAGAASPYPRPAAFSCHYLGVARFEPVSIFVESRRAGRVAGSQRVEVSQDGRAILDAMVWSTAEVEGLEHDETVPPDVPNPDDLPAFEELRPAGTAPPYPFWQNLEGKPVDFESEWPPDGPRPAKWCTWLRYVPTATFGDPWVDAARLLILVDLPSWPAAHRPHAHGPVPFIAPSLDLNVAFHRPATGDEWLLCDGSAPLSTGGLFGWRSQVWSTGGRLNATGGGQCIYRRR